LGTCKADDKKEYTTGNCDSCFYGHSWHEENKGEGNNENYDERTNQLEGGLP